MAANVSKLNMARLRRSSVFSVFQLDLLRELLCVLVAFCVLTQQSLADQQEFFEDFLKREYSLVKPYRGLGFSSSSQWDLMGTAMVTPDHVRLTPDQQSRQGAVWSRIPFVLRDWELRVHFKIHGIGKKNLNGDGIAIWLTRDRMQNGPVFGNMNQFVGLGIFVDTYPNTDKTHDRTFPYVSVMLGNGTLMYDHDRDGRTTELGGCTAMTRNSIYDTFLLVRYSKNKLTLMVDVDGKQEWRDCAEVSGLRLPTGYYLGASSATGDLSDNHDIISMKVYQLTVERTPEEEEEEEVITVPRLDDMYQFQVDVEEEGMSGLQLFFTLLFSVLGLSVLAVVGLVLYGRWKENKRKRFY
ncbi:PREDICTED: VIP36-like protein [Poecilia mexicana]|uniref:L-type lectin-like domain-containing protein n=1 Tax=Poecilia mexicana TaxID=48701 RepID=A0A3B3XDG5_9TELE|nr:PREDICTED: VIP36-like protein [Poecilia mexicana]XP_014834423.1 PREDICTED: VIP36-like protein [Poecilia mexicana]